MTSWNGQYVVFETRATNATALNMNAVWNIVLRDLAGQSNVLISVNAQGTESGNVHSLQPVISADGRAVTFKSNFTNLVAGATNKVFLRDWEAGVTTVVSHDEDPSIITNAVYPVLHDSPPAMTPDGRFVAYASVTNIYLFDRASNTTELVTVSLDGGGGANGVCRNPRISDNGRYVAFLSAATNLTTGSLDEDFQVYLRDMVAGQTTLVSRGLDGTGRGECPMLAMTPSGSVIVFQSLSNNLVPDDNNAWHDIFAYDRLAGTIERISESGAFTQSATTTGYLTIGRQSLSADGRYVAYASFPGAARTGDTSPWAALYRQDLITGISRLVNVNTNGTVSTGGMPDAPMMSQDGRYVAFRSTATDLVPETSGDHAQLYVRDLVDEKTRLVPHSEVKVTNVVGYRFSYEFAAAGRILLHESLDSVSSINYSQIYAYDIDQDTNILVTLDSDGLGPAPAFSYILTSARQGPVLMFRGLGATTSTISWYR